MPKKQPGPADHSRVRVRIIAKKRKGPSKRPGNARRSLAFMKIYDTALVQALRDPAFAARLPGARPSLLARISLYDDAFVMAASVAATAIAAVPSFLGAELVFGTGHGATTAGEASVVALIAAVAAGWAYRSMLREVRAAFPGGVRLDRDGMPASGSEGAGAREECARGTERTSCLVRLGGFCRACAHCLLAVDAVVALLLIADGQLESAGPLSVVLGCALTGGLLAVAGVVIRRAGSRALLDDSEKQGRRRE